MSFDWLYIGKNEMTSFSCGEIRFSYILIYNFVLGMQYAAIFSVSGGYSSDTDHKIKSAILHRTRKCYCRTLWNILQRLYNRNGYYGRTQFYTFEYKMSSRSISCIATNLWLRSNLPSYYESSSPATRQKVIVHLYDKTRLWVVRHFNAILSFCTIMYASRNLFLWVLMDCICELCDNSSSPHSIIRHPKSNDLIYKQRSVGYGSI